MFEKTLRTLQFMPTGLCKLLMRYLSTTHLTNSQLCNLRTEAILMIDVCRRKEPGLMYLVHDVQ